MEVNFLTVTREELMKLPLSERRRVMEQQASNHVKLKCEATRRASVVISELHDRLDGFRELWIKYDGQLQDDILFALEEKLIAEEEKRNDPDGN